MTLIAVPIRVETSGDVPEALERAAAAHASGADLIEWRIDTLAGEPDAADAVGRLVVGSPAPCIVTCRIGTEGGAFEGTESERLALLETTIGAAVPPRFIDLELAALDDHGLRTAARRWGSDPDGLRVILSAHDFDGRPADLLQRIESMTHEPAGAIHKIAWTARSLRDNLEAFDLLRARTRPTIALCMGIFGLPSRVLAPKFGGLVTYATDDPAEATAPGQPTLDDLRGLYRIDRIRPSTRVYGVIGWPVGHSRGPELHNAGFASIDFDGVYLPLPVGPEWEHFKATVDAFVEHPELDFSGASVTLPHKENLLRFVRERGGEVDRLAERIGAANTLRVGWDRTLFAMNTDAPAAVEALARTVGGDPRRLAERRIAVLGAGGVARAVVAGLADFGADVTVVNRTPARAEALADALSELAGTVHAAPMDALADGGFDVFVNATSVGMQGGPDPKGTPLPDDVELGPESIVFDTVYTPRRTPLLERAERDGATIVDGLAMFMGQAVRQFELWTERPMPDEVRQAFVRGGV